MLYKCEEWQSGSGLWHCGCMENLAGGSNEWYLPARILGLSPAAFVQYMIKEFNPLVTANKEKGLVFFSWQKQADMRKYKNFINKKARECNFQI